MQKIAVIMLFAVLFIFPVNAQSPTESSSGTLQLRFFTPTSTATPTPTVITTPAGHTPTATSTLAPEAVSTNTPTPANSTQPTLNGKTMQTDWVFNGQGRCWSAWTDNSCSLLSHEGGGTEAQRDFDGDGRADVTCSQGPGTSQSTTITNTSSKTFQIKCERYSCSACTSGNGSHAQCDGGIDPSATKIADIYEITPGCIATCTINGAIGTCLATAIPTSTPTNVPGQPTPTTTQPTPTPILIPITVPETNSSSIRELVKEIGTFYHAPWQVIEAMLHIEGEHVFNLSSSAVVQYQQPGAQDPTNCTPNVCSARGPAQFTSGIDNKGSSSCSACGLSKCPNTWNGYKNSVLEAVSDGRTPHICNLKDSVYAAGNKLKRDSGSAKDDSDWTYENVWRASRAYYGSCTSCDQAKQGTGAWYACRRLNMTYCDYVWQYYQKNK